VFVVFTCILLVICMLKVTLFKSWKQVFLLARLSRNHTPNEHFY
jgi:hypothetical protein